MRENVIEAAHSSPTFVQRFGFTVYHPTPQKHAKRHDNAESRDPGPRSHAHAAKSPFRSSASTITDPLIVGCLLTRNHELQSSTFR